MLLRRRRWLSCWPGGEAAGDDEGGARWLARNSLRRERGLKVADFREIKLMEGEKEIATVVAIMRDVGGRGGDGWLPLCVYDVLLQIFSVSSSSVKFSKPLLYSSPQFSHGFFSSICLFSSFFFLLHANR